jgi:lysophospholipase L1-like esterase
MCIMLRLTGDWEVTVEAGSHTVAGQRVTVPRATRLTVERPPRVHVVGEAHPSWPDSGIRPRELGAEPGCLKDRWLAASLRVRTAADAVTSPFTVERDYRAEPHWAVAWRQPEGGIPADRPVWLEYDYERSRLDTVALRPDGTVELFTGSPHLSRPRARTLVPGVTALANLWVAGGIERLTLNSLFPILETVSPPPPVITDPREALPQTAQRLAAGERLRVLAWGDSVTAAGWVPEPARWPKRLATWLRERFPKASLDVVVAGWGGHTSEDFLTAGAADPFRYGDHVLASGADLVVSEFVNDAKFPPQKVEELYGRYLRDFRDMGAEWIVITPHYTQPEWMGFTCEREIDEDPRPLIKTLRTFCAREGIALADAAWLWGRLWRRGIPYTTWMSNGVNHPDADGMSLFGESLAHLLEPLVPR